jgi:Putative amidoligase enzyme.
MSSKPLYSIFEYDVMPNYEKKIKEFMAQHPATMALPQLIDNKTFVGIEVEVESISTLLDQNPIWITLEDGSLRNHGREFVSNPIRGAAVPYALHSLKEFLEKSNKGHDFSDRTSIHIHMNARDMSAEQVVSFLITYLVFETILYKQAYDLGKKNREANIFCLPVSTSLYFLDIADGISSFEKGDEANAIYHLSRDWKKYTGLNLLPLQSKGTIEFRQMGGHLNIHSLIQWINLILSIKQYVIQRPYQDIKNQILMLNTNSMYEHFLRDVFGDFSDHLLRYNIKSELETGVVVVKKALTPVKHQGFAEETFLKSSLRSLLDANGYTFPNDIKAYKERLQKELASIQDKLVENSKEMAILNSRRTELGEQYKKTSNRLIRTRIETRKAELTHQMDEIHKQIAQIKVKLTEYAKARDALITKEIELMEILLIGEKPPLSEDWLTITDELPQGLRTPWNRLRR